MARIERTSVRLTIAVQLSRNPANRGRPLALEIKDMSSGRLLRASDILAAGVNGIGGVIAAAGSRVLETIKPEMLTSATLSFRVMKIPVTIAMFRQFVEDEKSRPDGYRIAGHNDIELIRLLADPKKSGQVIRYVSHEDATAFVNWRREKTGQVLRMPTEDDVLAAKMAVGNQLILSGENGLWEWTQTIHHGVSIILRSMHSRNQEDRHPGIRKDRFTVRLVEDKVTAEVDRLSQAATRKPQIGLPEMIDLSGELRIMKGEVTIGLFKQVMEGYDIAGHNSDELKALLADPAKAGESLTYVSLLDARDFAKRLSEQTGRKFRLKTNQEWDIAITTVGEKMSGKYWNWAEAEIESGSGTNLLRHLDGSFRFSNNPGNRYDNFALRLVED
ncbi:MAG: SUMF1/EgtB/PvdO family nonheme iron enzyme [Candidatus Saganbacteria bacterium]|nr:SUMF1/EgtB/PvdO family nonheme iron enzyme [Candidatus Saganbacteria bacterium]